MSGGRLPLYRDKRKTEVLLSAVEVCLKLTRSVLNDQELQRVAEHQIQEREGPAGVARVDQALAAAKTRLPVLHSLHTALIEHGAALERVRKED